MMPGKLGVDAIIKSPKPPPQDASRGIKKGPEDDVGWGGFQVVA